MATKTNRKVVSDGNGKVRIVQEEFQPQQAVLAQMVFVPADEKKTCWSYRRDVSEDALPKVLVSNGPEMLYVRKTVLTGVAGKKLRVTIEVLP